jgi:nucleoside-diphosphate-sugar epimerase
MPLTPDSVVDTVALCERIGYALDEAAEQANSAALARTAAEEVQLPPVMAANGTVLVTGGTGLLGRRVAEELRKSGFKVRVLARRTPPATARVSGVDYVAGDLARALDPALLRGVRYVAHCAAETAGGKADHERNSIAATRHVLEAAAAAGVAGVVHISSIAVLKPGHQVGGPLDEETPVDAGNLERGPYVWGKAESEILAQRLGAELGVPVKVIRPGPLVDYAEFQPPGRLGRELGPWFVAIGGKTTPLSVCDVGTAARVIRSYVEDFAAAPAVVNLVEAPPPTRRELADRVRSARPDLRFLWVPAPLLRMMSGPAKLAQKVLLGSAKPVDVYAAFASERYRTDRAAEVIHRAGSRPVPRSASRDAVGSR